MAQVLKEESRDMIIDAAKEEFLEHGFKGSSMRRIAQNSNMTAGNLYRYFRSKEDLLAIIVAPAYNAIDRILGELTNHTVSFRNKEFDLNATQEELAGMLDKLGDALVETHKKHRIELNILMMSSKLNDELVNWFADLLENLIAGKYNLPPETKSVKILAKGYAVSVFDGLKEILKVSDVDDEEMKRISKIFLNSFLLMLDYDARKYAE